MYLRGLLNAEGQSRMVLPVFCFKMLDEINPKLLNRLDKKCYKSPIVLNKGTVTAWLTDVLISKLLMYVPKLRQDTTGSHYFMCL